MQKITPNLWFNNEAEEAVKLYTSLFTNSRIITTTYYPQAAEEVSGQPAGSVMTVEFELEGQRFLALNGGSAFTFNEAISFIINCEDQAEVDRLWEKLSEGGDSTSQQCGWLKDKYGLSWQIVPKRLGELLSDSDQKRVERAASAMLKMKKIDIATLEAAANSNE